MISVKEALQLVLSHASPGKTARVPVLESVGCVLAEEVISDIDSPPHDKAMMDGYAICIDDLVADSEEESPVELDIIEEVTAGDVPTKPLSSGKATRIMTGAPVPENVGAVVMVEQTDLLRESSQEQPARVRIQNAALPEGANILPRATSLAIGQTVLARGTAIRPIEVGVLSEVGKTEVEVFGRPTVAVMTSGNELVTPDVKPGPGQIRNSNNPMLVALAQRAGGIVTDLGIARDEENAIRDLVSAGLKHDVLILSGGVSAGVLDLVPKVLSDSGVEQVFHKVKLKPGKPVWFGVCKSNEQKTLVFGLPGNPVSSLVCFELFTRAAMAKMRGGDEAAPPAQRARLQTPHQQRGDRPVYFPGALIDGEDGLAVTALPWQGSADLSTLAQANCLIYFPAGERQYDAGEVVIVYPQ